jgi:hypothetical protein
MLHNFPRKPRGLGAMQKQPSWAALAVLHASSYEIVDTLTGQVETFVHQLHDMRYPVKNVIIGVAYVETEIGVELHQRLQHLSRKGALPVKLDVMPIRSCLDEFGFASNALALEAAHKGCDTYLFCSPATFGYFDHDLLRLMGEGFDQGLSAMGGITSRDLTLLGSGHIVRNISIFDANLFHMLGGFSVRTETTLGGFGNLVSPEQGETSRLVMALADYSLGRNMGGVVTQIDLTTVGHRHTSYDAGGEVDEAVGERSNSRRMRYDAPLPPRALSIIQEMAGDPLQL